MPPDAFDILGLPPTFDLDPLALKRAFLTRSAQSHPDAIRTGPAQSPLGTSITTPSASFSPPPASPASINAAHALLANPEQRANLLLARLAGPTKEANRTLPDGFLMEMMDIREQMQETGTTEAARDRWRQWGDARRDQHIAAVQALFAGCDFSASTPPASNPPAPAPAAPAAAAPALLAALRRELNAWRYIERMLEQIDSGSAGEAGGPGL